jgi:hypothetical protein
MPQPLTWMVRVSVFVWSSPLTSPAWEALPVAYATTGVALRII